MLFTPEAIRNVTDFVAGSMSAADFTAWVVSAEWDDAIIESEREDLHRLRLLTLEYTEQLCSLDDVRAEAAAMIPRARLEVDDATSSNTIEPMVVNLTSPSVQATPA